VAKLPPFSELIAETQTSAVHLEMRDAYTPSDPAFLEWKAGGPPADEPAWRDLIRANVARGVRVRRARVVSEPLSDFIRFEYESVAGINIAGGEDVRWLPRRLASDLCLPGNDFWLFDDRLLRFGYFAGNGDFLSNELDDRPDVVKMCGAAFEAVWQRAIPHADYRPA